MLNLAPALQYTHPVDGPLIDVYEARPATYRGLEKALLNGFDDATCITVALPGDGRDPSPVECDICGTGGLGIRHVTALTIACISCRVARSLNVYHEEQK